MPIILAHDGPSLGGFVCPATVVQSELWKIGQLKPGDTVRFFPVDLAWAEAQEALQNQQLLNPMPLPVNQVLNTEASIVRMSSGSLMSPIIARVLDEHPGFAITYRQAGDKYLLVEYGDLVLDLPLRFRVHALMLWLQERKLQGIIDITPGIRSLQVHYDNCELPRQALLDTLRQAETELHDVETMEVPTRIVHLPLSWDDSATQEAIRKYMQSVRSDAPWCPSNLEFIRRINGLRDIEEVKQIVFDASYLVLGLGDVYLGAPVATPIDPRHRLVTTKYNPARTWTPENAVGIGGAYLCIYGMEGPGGYQFVGRTVPVWNRYRRTEDFTKPWLLRFFDQIRFFPVSAEELLTYRSDLIQGKLKLEIQEETFRLQNYQKFLDNNAQSIAEFRERQRAAFAAERERWVMAGEFSRQEELSTESASVTPEIEVAANQNPITADVSGTVWQILVEVGQYVEEGQNVLILEAMKMEIPVAAPTSGQVAQVTCNPSDLVTAGQVLVVLEAG